VKKEYFILLLSLITIFIKRKWDKDFPEYEFAIIIYPGRSTRFNDELITTMDEYITQLDKGFLPYITKPCFFIGHRYYIFYD
jgi:surfactin synthase thioesterase subunit